MLDAVFAVPGDLDTPTGGYIYDRRVMDLLPARGVRVHHLALPGSFPNPSAADLEATGRLIQTTPPQALIVFDGLAFGAIPAAVVAQLRRRIVALVHHPLALETGLSEARRKDLLALERAALALAHHVIVTSASTAETVMTLFGVAADCVTCAEPGTDAAPRARGSGGAPHILAVGAVVPRKGYDILVQALAKIADRPWQATFAGTLDRAAEHVTALRADLARLSLSERVRLAGTLDPAALAAAYDSADLFVSSSWYEGFGMVLTEAMARGLAMVTTTGGAAGATVPDAAAIKIAPGDTDALARAIGRLIDEPATRRQLADAAWTHAQGLPRWSDTADRIAGALARVARKAAIA